MDWQPIETAPRDGKSFLATVRVYSHKTGEFLYHDTHIVWCDDETGDIDVEAEAGWRLEDYERWQPLPDPPIYPPESEPLPA